MCRGTAPHTRAHPFGITASDVFSVPVHQRISHVTVGGKHSIRGENGAFDVVVSLIRPGNHMPATGTCGRTEHLPFTFWHVSYRDFVPNIVFRIQASMLFLTFASTGISNWIHWDGMTLSVLVYRRAARDMSCSWRLTKWWGRKHKSTYTVSQFLSSRIEGSM